MVARTLPGKQFEVGRDLRARVVSAFGQQGMAVPPPAATTSAPDAAPSAALDGGSREAGR